MSYQTPTRVNGPARNTLSGNGTLTISLTWTPVQNDVLILWATCGATNVNPTFGTPSCTNVTWTLLKSDATVFQTAVWIGVIGANAGTSVTVSVTGGTGTIGSVGDVAEFSWVATSITQPDKTATNNNSSGTSTSTDSGTTSSTTTSIELVVATIGAAQTNGNSMAQSSPTNGFTLLDGASYTQGTSFSISCGALYKIVTVEGTQDTGTAVANGCYWDSVIATLFTTQPLTYACHWLW